MRYHMSKKFFGKMVKIKETSFLSTREDTNFLPPLYLYQQLRICTLQYREEGLPRRENCKQILYVANSIRK